MAGEEPLNIANRGELKIVNSVHTRTGARITDWAHFTADDKAYVGRADKDESELSLADLVAGLKRVPDHIIYPETPAGTHLTIAPEHLGDGGGAVFVKRMAFGRAMAYGTSNNLAAEGLNEVLALEKVSKTPHPYIVRYHGCRIQRGRVTRVVLEKLRYSLYNYAYDQRSAGGDGDGDGDVVDRGVLRAKFERLDKEAFLAGVESAVRFLHSLGLAHNDISPANVMVREADDDGACAPVLIDFGACAPFGAEARARVTPGFADVEDAERCVSRARHDDFALARLREWWDKDHVRERDGSARALMEKLAERNREKWKHILDAEDTEDTDDTDDTEDMEDVEDPKA